MCGMTDGVVEPGIRCHLAIALPARPLLGAGEECTTMPVAPDIRIDIPGFHIADRTRVAAIGVGTCSDLDEAREAAICPLDDEHVGISARAKLPHTACQL